MNTFVRIAILPLTVAYLAGCGSDSSKGGPEEDLDASVEDTSRPKPDGSCLDWVQWICTSGQSRCFASCQEGETKFAISCDRESCNRQTNDSDIEACSGITPSESNECKDCEAAFNAACY
jgi:hypothetical protein